jgi:hypothetical protein
MFIDEVMDLVELTGLKNAMVGLAGATGLSAEQRKRLTIAVELVASPSIIFMDEPTTGLDARADEQQQMMQMIPVWWRWVYWANPAAWTVYGLMFSQLGDRTELIQVPGQPEQTVKEFLEGYLGLQDRYFNLVTSLHVAIIALFTFLFFLSIKHLKFQRR